MLAGLGFSLVVGRRPPCLVMSLHRAVSSMAASHRVSEERDTEAQTEASLPVT